MKISNLLPFMDEEDVDLYLNKLVEKDNLAMSKVVSVLPFASEKAIDQAFVKLYNQPDANYGLSGFYPFISSKAMHQIVLAYINDNGKPITQSMLPFMDDKDIKLLMHYEVSKEDLDKDDLDD
ncbi:MAG: hypothetical protein RR418_01665, partial [Clostridia bacterium]